jgi:hypothetical protein
MTSERTMTPEQRVEDAARAIADLQWQKVDWATSHELATAALAPAEARIAELEAEVARLGQLALDRAMLLAKYGDRVRMASSDIYRQPLIDDALEGRCSNCGGLHFGMLGDCMGPPLPNGSIPWKQFA